MAQEQKQNQPQEQKPEIMDATADSIFAVGCDVKHELFDIPGAGRVWIHRISNLDAKQWSKSIEEDDDYADAKLIQRCVHNSKGEKVFKIYQIPKIVTMGQDIVSGLIRLCLKINGMGDIGTAAIVKN